MEASHSWRVKTFQRVRCWHRGFHGLLLDIRFDALLMSHHADGSAASKAAWCNCAWILLHCAHPRTWRKRHNQKKKMLFNQLICRPTPVKPVQPKAPPGDRIQSQLPEGLTSALFLGSVLKTVVTSGSVLFGTLSAHWQGVKFHPTWCDFYRLGLSVFS